jgi:thiamine biosynthesis lipoprotein
MIHVEHMMGTVVSFDIRDADASSACVDGAVAALHRADRLFSTYRADSEISRLARDEITLDECSADVREVLAACEALRRRTDGAFDIRYGHALDPSAYVKGWAAERAASVLWQAGVRNAAINAGGDVLVSGEPEPGRAWRVGIRHPEIAARTVAVVGLRDSAIATSGLYERGGHIVDPATGGAPRELLSLSVIASTLAEADALSTAGFVMGERGVEWVAAQPGCSVLAVTAGGRLRYSDGIELLPAEVGDA